MILFSCREATDRMTDLMEGEISFFDGLALRSHLSICPGCRKFLASLRRVPAFLKELFEEPPVAPPEGGLVLDRVLASIRQGQAQGPRQHPAPQLWSALAAGSADLPQRLMLETHLGSCAACRAEHPGHAAHEIPESARLSAEVPPLPASLRALLPPESSWSWMRKGLGGARSARLLLDKASGASLYLSFLPPGSRFPQHHHAAAEAALVLDGWVQDGPFLVGPGDYLEHDDGTQHAPEAVGPDGCWILARLGPGGLRFKGWRGLFS